jgi:hypothetical protein
MKEKSETEAQEVVRKIIDDIRHPEYGQSLQNTLNILR